MCLALEDFKKSQRAAYVFLKKKFILMDHLALVDPCDHCVNKTQN